MKLPVKTYISILAFIWFGYVAGISFLEAPLKFQAPGITLALGVGIGRIVFVTLNKVELVFALAVSLIAFFKSDIRIIRIYVTALLLILAMQTLWLLPYLDARAEVVISGHEPEPSYLHFVYIVLDVLKLFLLLLAGIKNFQSVIAERKD